MSRVDFSGSRIPVQLHIEAVFEVSGRFRFRGFNRKKSGDLREQPGRLVHFAGAQQQFGLQPLGHRGVARAVGPALRDFHFTGLISRQRQLFG